MRKRSLLFLLCLISWLPVVRPAQDIRPRGLFVSVIQNPPVLSDHKAITSLVEFAKASHVQTIFVQIYYAGQTWFPSAIGDPEPYKSCMAKTGEDSFALLIRTAHASGIEVHAWLNLLSLNRNLHAPLLKKYGPEILTRDATAKSTLEDYKIDNQFFLEPGDLRVRKEVLGLVREVLTTYPELDGVQFDYIRYPDTHPVYGYNDQNISRFKKARKLRKIEDNAPVWQDWKRTQVTELLKMLAQETRTLRPKIKISTTGCMPYARAYYEAFQDWPAWIDGGLVDFVTIMDYSPDPVQFERWITVIKTKTRAFSKVNIAVGAYKLLNHPDIFTNEYRICESIAAGACVAFHYGSLLQEPALQTPFFELQSEKTIT